MAARSLPNEILLEIFEWGCYIDFISRMSTPSSTDSYAFERRLKPFLQPAILVCRQWLALVSTTSSSWVTRIVLTDRHPRSSASPESFPDLFYYEDRRSIESFLLRSTDADLDIVVTLKSSSSDHSAFQLHSLATWALALDILACHSKRWRLFSCFGPSIAPLPIQDMLFKRMNNTRVFPRLLEFYHNNTGSSKQHVPPSFSAPNLVKLGTHSPKLWCMINLTHLNIREGDEATSGWIPLAQHSAGTLRELDVRNRSQHHTPAELLNDLQVMQFSRLNKLVLSNLPPSILIKLFDVLCAPRLSSLEIRNTWCQAPDLIALAGTHYKEHPAPALQSLLLLLSGEWTKEISLFFCRLLAPNSLQTLTLRFSDSAGYLAQSPLIALPNLEALTIFTDAHDIVWFLLQFNMPKLSFLKAVTSSVGFWHRSKPARVVLPSLQVLQVGPIVDFCASMEAPNLATLEARGVISWRMHETAWRSSLKNITNLEIGTSGLDVLHQFERLRVLTFCDFDVEIQYFLLRLCHILLGAATATATTCANGNNALEKSLTKAKRLFRKRSSRSEPLRISVLPSLLELHIVIRSSFATPVFSSRVVSKLKEVVQHRIAGDRPLQALALTPMQLGKELVWFQNNVPSVKVKVGTTTSSDLVSQEVAY